MVVYGRQTLDALHLMRGSAQRFEDYRLGTVAQVVLGRGKTLQADEDGAACPHADQLTQAFNAPLLTDEEEATLRNVTITDAHEVTHINGKPLEPEKLYMVAVYQFLLSGLNVIQPLLGYVQENVPVPDVEACLPIKEIVISA